MRLPSSLTMISLGLAFLTLSVVLAAQSIGFVPNDDAALTRARTQAVRLLAAQCAPAAKAGDTAAMGDLVGQVAAANEDVQSVNLFDASGATAFTVGQSTDPSVNTAGVRLPVIDPADGHTLAEIEFHYRPLSRFESYVPGVLRPLLSNPALRLALFVAVVGFAAYRFYLRRMLRTLDPTSVIPPRVKAMLDALAEGVLVLDRRGVIVMANDSFGAATGMNVAKLGGHRADRLGWQHTHSGGPAKTLPWTSVLQTGQSLVGVPLALIDVPNRAEAGKAAGVSERVFMVNAAAVLSPDGKVRGSLVTFDDVTELEQINLALKVSQEEIERKNVELFRLATTDPLTGCLNRRSFLEKFAVAWQTAQVDAAASPGRQSLGCVMTDVDRFKSINDRFGHAAGDAVLKDVSRILRDAATARGDGTIVCRYGGEEFCVLLPGADLDATAEFAETLRRTLEAGPWEITPVTASLGVSASPQGAADPKELLDWADRALYNSKRTGRNRVTRWGSIPAEEPAAEPTAPAAAPILTPVALIDPPVRGAFLGLVTALSHGDRQTALHCRRVADYCLLAAPGLIPPDEAAMLEVAALLHDVGKLGVPDAILHKVAPLTDAEWTVLRTHDLMGVDILSAAGMPDEAVGIMAAHHTRFVAGPGESPSAVRVSSRLLSVADAFDAMTSDRPYRAAMGRDDAFAELRACGGGQFDPDVVEHFIRAIAPAGVALPVSDATTLRAA